MDRGAIILCGGRSSRMGRDKVLLPFGLHETLLQRVVRIVAAVVPAEQIVCVAAADQALPQLPGGVQIARDTERWEGPLKALALGMTMFADTPAALFVCGCDAPLLLPPFVKLMFELLNEHHIAVTEIEGVVYPLPAMYRSDILPTAQDLLSAGERSLKALVASYDARLIGADELRGVDPSLAALERCNTPSEYERLLARGLTEM